MTTLYIDPGLLCIVIGQTPGGGVAKALYMVVAQTTIFMPVAIVLGFRGQALIAILVLLGAPTTPSSYIMAQNMNNDGVLANSLVVCTTLFSSLTVTGWIFLLRAAGLL